MDSFDADLTPPVRDLAVSRLSLRTDMPANVGRLVAPSIQPRLCFSLRHGEPATTLIGCQPERKKIRMLHRKYFEKQRLKDPRRIGPISWRKHDRLPALQSKISAPRLPSPRETWPHRRRVQRNFRHPFVARADVQAISRALWMDGPTQRAGPPARQEVKVLRFFGASSRKKNARTCRS